MGYLHKQWSATFLAPGTSFVEDSFSRPGRGGMVWDDSSALHLLCTLFPIECYCWSDRYQSVAQRLVTPDLGKRYSPNGPYLISQNHAWINDEFRVQDRPVMKQSMWKFIDTLRFHFATKIWEITIGRALVEYQRKILTFIWNIKIVFLFPTS